MNDICWICNENEADSGEHVITKASLDFIFGKPSDGDERFVTHVDGAKNVPVKSFKGDRLKFDKSICKRCNNALSQPYDNAFNLFVRNLFKTKGNVVTRKTVNLRGLLLQDRQYRKNLGIYLQKIFGCLIVQHQVRISDSDFKSIRDSILTGNQRRSNLWFSMHRDIKKLAARDSVCVAQYPVFAENVIGWTIDLDWVSIVLSYPNAPPLQYGDSWEIGVDTTKLKLGKIK